MSDAAIENKTNFPLGTVYLYSTYCNLKCRHCWINPPYSPRAGLRPDELPLDNIVSALDECRAIGMHSVKLTGGEPFVRRDIFGLLEYLGKNNITVYVETNAALIGDKEAGALRDAKARQVAVSLDGPDAASHEALRGVAGSFEDTLKGIKALKKAGLNTQVIISLWRGNMSLIRQTVELARSLQAASVKINPVHAMERAGGMDERGETLNVGEVLEFHERFIKDTADMKDIKIIFDIPPAFRALKGMRTADLRSCNIFSILGILGDGRISICGIGSNVDTLVLGRVGVDSIKDIWQDHPVLKEIREGVPGKMAGVCGRCVFKYYCLGKCRAEAYYNSGSVLSPLTFCQSAYDAGLFPASRLA